jgi:hypothetical protein
MMKKRGTAPQGDKPKTAFGGKKNKKHGIKRKGTCGKR